MSERPAPYLALGALFVAASVLLLYLGRDIGFFFDEWNFVLGRRELVQFHEFFHGDTGAGLGASHQTGWTALITRCMNMVARVQEE